MWIPSLIRKRPSLGVLAGIAVFLLITLPGAVDAWWSLIDRWSGLDGVDSMLADLPVTIWLPIASSVLSLAVLVWIGFVFREIRREQYPVVPDRRSDDNPVSQTRVDRLHEAYPTIQTAFLRSRDFLLTDLAITHGKGNTAKTLLAEMVEQYPVRRFGALASELNKAILGLGEAPPRDEFEKALDLMVEASAEYIQIIGLIRRLADSFLEDGRELRKVRGYETLYKRHEEYLDELRRVRGHPVIGRIATHLSDMPLLDPPKTESNPSPLRLRATEVPTSDRKDLITAWRRMHAAALRGYSKKGLSYLSEIGLSEDWTSLKRAMKPETAQRLDRMTDPIGMEKVLRAFGERLPPAARLVEGEISRLASEWGVP